MPSKPPVWIRQILKNYRTPIDTWLRKFIADRDGAPYWEPALEALGGGHFGFAYRLHRQGKAMEGPATHLVFKVTRDPTEGPFCRWIQEEQEKESMLFCGGFARMHDVRRLPHEIDWRGKQWPCYIIVREEVEPVLGAGGYLPPGLGTVTRALQMAGRALSTPRKRGRARLEMQMDSHGGMAFFGEPFFYGTRPARRLFDAEDVWNEALNRLGAYPGYEYVADTFARILDEYGIHLQDVHLGNLGRRLVEQGDEWSGVGTIVIFDPGHTPTNQGLPIERLANPRRRGRAVPLLGAR